MKIWHFWLVTQLMKSKENGCWDQEAIMKETADNIPKLLAKYLEGQSLLSLKEIKPTKGQ